MKRVVSGELVFLVNWNERGMEVAVKKTFFLRMNGVKRGACQMNRRVNNEEKKEVNRKSTR